MERLYNKNIKWIKCNADKCHIDREQLSTIIMYQVGATKEEGCPSLVARSGNQEYAIHSQHYPTKEAAQIAENTALSSSTIVIVGMGLGYVATQIRERYPDKKLILIEPDINVFYWAIKYCDLQYINFDAVFVGYDDAQLTGVFPKPSSSFDIYIQKSQQRLYPQVFNRIENFLLGKPNFQLNEQWRYKKFQNEQCRIIFIDSAYLLSRECLSAIKNTGHIVHYIHIDLDNYDYEQFIHKLLNDISQFRPDFVLTINHLGFDKEGRLTELFSEMELPFVSWFVDSPDVILSSFDRNISDWCNIFVWDDDYIPKIRDKGYSHCDYLPLATDMEIFYPKETAYLYPVSFVGSSMSFAIHKNMKSWCHRDDLLKAFPQVVAQILATRNVPSIKEIEAIIVAMSSSPQSVAAMSSSPFDTPSQAEDFRAACLWRATQLYRQSGIERLADFTPVISGDPNWINILPVEFELLSERWYYDNLCDFYNQSQINFNMTSLQMKNAINQRVFDVSACQSFLITDYRRQIDELFDGKENIVYFTDVTEIPELVKFYQKNESERKKFSNKAYNLVFYKHTYNHRLMTMIEVLRRRYR